MIKPEELIQKLLDVRELLKQIIRMLPEVRIPEFSSEPMSVKDVSELTGIPEGSVRAGILYGWFPIGVAVNNGKEVHGPVGNGTRVNFIIFPRKIWEITGHVWTGKGGQA